MAMSRVLDTLMEALDNDAVLHYRFTVLAEDREALMREASDHGYHLTREETEMLTERLSHPSDEDLEQVAGGWAATVQ